MSVRPDAIWSYTRDIQELGANGMFGFLEEQGETKLTTYLGRQVITRGSPIDKGVYVVANAGGFSCEAVVIDFDDDPRLQRIYQNFLQELYDLSRSQQRPLHEIILQFAFEYAKRVIPYSQERTDSIIQQVGVGTKIYLSDFFGGGVCRHQGLLAAAILERVIQNGVIIGRVSVEKNIIPKVGGHSWARYEPAIGEPTIIDPAQNFVGLLSEANALTTAWSYSRPTDQIQPKQTSFAASAHENSGQEQAWGWGKTAVELARFGLSRLRNQRYT